MRAKSYHKEGREPTIALINIVFLMLIFFMVAGTLAPPVDPALKLINTKDLDGVNPPDALVVMPTGELRYRGVSVEGVEPYLARLGGDALNVARLLPDQNAPAVAVIAAAHALRAAGAERVVIMTEKALK